MKNQKTTKAGERTQWPKFKVETFSGGETVTEILERPEAEARELALMKKHTRGYDRRYATKAHTSTTFHQLAEGHIISVEPGHSRVRFSRYTFEDSVRDAAMDLYNAVKGIMAHEGEDFSTFSWAAANAAVSKAERQG